MAQTSLYPCPCTDLSKPPGGRVLGPAAAILLSLLLALVSGCQTPATVSYLELQAAALKTLERAIEVQETRRLLALERQAAIAEQEAEARCQAWQRHFWPQVVGADELYSRSIASSVVEYGGQSFSLHARDYGEKVAQEARARVRAAWRRHGGAGLCPSQWLAADAPPWLEPHLQQQLIAFSAEPETATSRPGEALPRLARQAPAPLAPGRTYFALQKQLARESSCAGADLITLSNRWPRETYLSLCERQAGALRPQLIDCLWGECGLRESAQRKLR